MLGGGNGYTGFPLSNWTPEMTILAELIRYVLEPAALRTSVDKALNPAIIVVRAKEIFIWDALAAGPGTADVTLFSP